jgi:KUP system potassium uptake protein
MVTLVALLVWRFNVFIVIAVALPFALLDGVYLSSALTKIPTGAWFTIVLSIILASIFVLWRYGKDNQWAAEASDRVPANLLMHVNANNELAFTPRFGGGVINTVTGLGVFFDKSGSDKVPTVFAQFVRKFMARTDIVVFFHMRPIAVPSIPPSERFIITRTGIPDAFRVTLRHGYADKVVTPDLGRLLCEQLILYITRSGASMSSATSRGSEAEHGNEADITDAAPRTRNKDEYPPSIRREIEALERAQAAQTVYIMGKEQMKIRQGTNIVRRLLLGLFLWIRENSRTKLADLDVQVERLVEVGFVKEI